MATSVEEALAGARKVEYPVLVRPSYVLGGRAMVIAYDDAEVVRYMTTAIEYSQERPVLIDHFLEDAQEVDVDALCDGKDVVIAGIMQHIEEAGVHSGDSSLRAAGGGSVAGGDADDARVHAEAGAGAECDRAGESAVRDSARQGVCDRGESAGVAHGAVCVEGDGRAAGEGCVAADDGQDAAELLPEQVASGEDLGTGEHFFVKSPVFPWGKFQGVDTVLGPEMKSTGEVMGVADDVWRGVCQGADGGRAASADGAARCSSA